MNKNIKLYNIYALFFKNAQYIKNILQTVSGKIPIQI